MQKTTAFKIFLQKYHEQIITISNLYVILNYRKTNKYEKRSVYMNKEIKCPECENIIRIDQANFCGACGTNITSIKQRMYQQMYQAQQPPQPMQQQMQYNMQQQMMYQQFYQQQMYHKSYKTKQSSPMNKFLFWLLKFGILILIVGIIYLGTLSLTSYVDTSVFSGGIDESLFYNYFAPSSQQSDEYYQVGGISTQEYAKLKNGMSYALASSIIGGDGDLVNTGENVHAQFYYTYRWYSELDEDLVYYITFVEDEISEIMLDQKL